MVEPGGQTMKLTHAVAIALWALTAATQPASAASQPRSGLTGMWRLARTEQKMADGTTRPDPDLGAHPAGYMTYDPAGRMCTVFNNTDRPRWAAARPNEAELRAMFDNMVVYCARYRVDEARKVIVFDMEFSQSPNNTGSSRERRFELLGDSLKLFPNPLPPGVVAWSVELQRMRP
jgi:hypothetical protein